ncbi:DUF3078 domain-containing protein [Panacibacter sp. DH6]|uniref:DUF3078 domain-containing protein n=1 Tax=Panacibacter microcysteis TaxID=2793269 RepID=A0A931E3C9_9BACT|nr:DUF3078 domain-containing protein [Panacibacter microcysteis]MBG9377842.1 DUF3078 domain-containing protein [Panacibacter microcysteis]
MRRLFLFFIVVCFTQVVLCQDIPVKTLPTEIFKSVTRKATDTITVWKWKRGGMINVNLSQGTLSNWAAGGDNFSLATAAYVNYYVYNKGKRYNWDNNIDFNFGLIKTSSLGTRKNDDRVEVISKYGLKVDTASKIFASALYNFRSQLFDGLTYVGDSGYLSSSFMSPAYFLLSLGFDYRPSPVFSLFLSPLTERITLVSSKRLYTKGVYGVPAGRKYITQIGAFASINFNKEIFKNVTYRGKMDLFSDYTNNPANVDMYFTNIFAFKINKWLSATYNLDMIYDDDVRLFGKNKTSPGLQLKSLIGIGFLMPMNPVVN